MKTNLKEKLLAFVQNGMQFNSFTPDEFEQIKKQLSEKTEIVTTTKPLPKLVSTKFAMEHLHCSKNNLNDYLNRGYLKRVKFSHRRIMIEYNSLRNFMEYGI